MSEENKSEEETEEVETEEETESQEETESKEKFDPARAKAKIKKANSEAAGLRKRLEELEDKEKSESEKLNDRATAAEGKAASAEKEAARYRVALRKGLTETQAKRLVGDDEEALEEDADQLLKDFKSEEETEEVETEETKTETTSTRERPKEKLKPGASRSSEPEENDPRKLAESVPDPF